MADFFESREVPEVRKITTLLWFDRLHRAIIAFEENAFTVRLVFQDKSLSIVAKLKELLHEVELAELFERSEAGNLFITQAHLPGPSTTGRATLAFVKNRHAAD